jgi:hypothetical protein
MPLSDVTQCIAEVTVELRNVRIQFKCQLKKFKRAVDVACLREEKAQIMERIGVARIRDENSLIGDYYAGKIPRSVLN